MKAFREGENVGEFIRSDSERDVDVPRQSGFSIEKDRLPADDHVGNIRGFEFAG